MRNAFRKGDDVSLRRGCDAGDPRACDRLFLRDVAFDRDKAKQRTKERCDKGEAEECYLAGELAEVAQPRIADALCQRLYGALCPTPRSDDAASISMYVRACELGLGVGCRRAEELLTFDPIPEVTNWPPGDFLKAFAGTKPVPTPDSKDEQALRSAKCRGGFVESCTKDEIEVAMRRGGSLGDH
jgi:hypothetical protein